MNADDDSVLTEAAAAVADGMSVDWVGLREREPGLAEDLDRLRALAEVAVAYRQVRRGED